MHNHKHTYIYMYTYTYIHTLHTGKKLFSLKGEGHYDIIFCLCYCSMSWATFHLNGQAAKRTWKAHADGNSAVCPDGFSTVLVEPASGFTLRSVHCHISLGNAMTWEHEETLQNHHSDVASAWWGDQCKETEENNRMWKTRDLFKKTRDIKGTFHAKMSRIKDRNGMDLTEAEDIKKRWQKYTEKLTKKFLMTQITAMVWSLT